LKANPKKGSANRRNPAIDDETACGGDLFGVMENQ
jgi:hypothetical protein